MSNEVWVLTYNDGDYYSTYDEYVSVHATKELAQAAARAQAEHLKQSFIKEGEISEWVRSEVANGTWWKGDPREVQQQYRGHTWYVKPEEIQP